MLKCWQHGGCRALLCDERPGAVHVGHSQFLVVLIGFKTDIPRETAGPTSHTAGDCKSLGKGEKSCTAAWKGGVRNV